MNNIADKLEAPLLKALYVVDLAVLCSGNDIHEIAQKVQEGIDVVVREAEEIGFTILRAKTKAIHFCRLRREHNAHPLKLKGTALEFVDSIRYLGLIFDEKLR